MHDALSHAPEAARHFAWRVGDATSAVAAVASLLDWAPHLAGGLAVVWWLVRLYYEIRTGERKLRQLRRPPQ